MCVGVGGLKALTEVAEGKGSERGTDLGVSKVSEEIPTGPDVSGGPEFGVTGSGVGVGVQARCGGGVGWRVGGDSSGIIKRYSLRRGGVSMSGGAVRYVRGSVSGSTDSVACRPNCAGRLGTRPRRMSARRTVSGVWGEGGLNETGAVSGVRGLTARVSDPAMGAPRGHQTLGDGGGKGEVGPLLAPVTRSFPTSSTPAPGPMTGPCLTLNSDACAAARPPRPLTGWDASLSPPPLPPPATTTPPRVPLRRAPREGSMTRPDWLYDNQPEMEMVMIGGHKADGQPLKPIAAGVEA